MEETFIEESLTSFYRRALSNSFIEQRLSNTLTNKPTRRTNLAPLKIAVRRQCLERISKLKATIGPDSPVSIRRGVSKFRAIFASSSISELQRQKLCRPCKSSVFRFRLEKMVQAPLTSLASLANRVRTPNCLSELVEWIVLAKKKSSLRKGILSKREPNPHHGSNGLYPPNGFHRINQLPLVTLAGWLRLTKWPD